MELVIGTATFGSGYGIANRGRFLREADALEILSAAQNLGISSLDTAPAYSNSEEIIGIFHSAHPKFDCYSKLSPQALTSSTETQLAIENSLKNMKVESLKGLYFHNPIDLLANDPAQIETLIDVIEETKSVEKIGVSIYELSELIAIQERHPRISLFQVPENIADQRLRHSQEIMRFHQAGIEFHIRSVFLQGLLLMEKAPNQLLGAQPFIDRLRSTAHNRSCSPVDLCLSYVKQLAWASKFIVGISEVTQLQEIFCARYDLSIEIDESLPNDILDPRRWISGS
jgi:aryl-alcohol dehydrogenase-like predicted oxidoreductase